MIWRKILSFFKISLPGFDVHNSRISEEVVDSLYPNPKIDATANPKHAGIVYVNWTSTASITANSTRVIYTFPHGYNYVPSVFGTYHFDNGTNRVNGVMPLQIGAIGMLVLDADATNINLKYFAINTSVVLAFTAQVRFYVFVERGL